MIDHPFKAHEAWKDRDSCEERLHDPNDENIYGICGAPRSAHMDSEHALKIQLATALRERDEALAQETYWHNRTTETRDALDAAESERDALRAAYRALRLIDDAYWGEFCGYCGVILSLESQDEACGPQHTAVQLAHEWLDKNPEPR